MKDGGNDTDIIYTLALEFLYPLNYFSLPQSCSNIPIAQDFR